MLKGFVIIAVLLFFWVFYIYLTVITGKRNAKNNFDTVKTIMEKRYGLIPEIVSVFQHDDSIQQTTDELNNLCSRIKSLNYCYSNIDRIIALDCEFGKKLGQTVQIIKDSKAENNKTAFILEQYNNITNSLNKKIEIYNTSAKKLKYLVDTFPYSFLARLNIVKTLDCIDE